MQTGKLDEPIISPLLTLTMSLQLPAWLTFLESKKCRLTRGLSDKERPAQDRHPLLPDNELSKTRLQICVVEDLLSFQVGRALMMTPPSVLVTLLRLFGSSATSWSSIFRS